MEGRQNGSLSGKGLRQEHGWRATDCEAVVARVAVVKRVRGSG